VAPANLTGEEPYDSADLGALHGAILFAGEVPERFALGAASAPECKHHPEVDQRRNDVIAEGGKLANVYVYIKSGHDPARIPPAPSTAVTLDQRGCMYVPRVVALQLGQMLRVSNGDPTTHNVHLEARRNARANSSMGKDQTPLEFRFDRAERPIHVKCDIHPWMGAAVFVEEHPWFAVTDEHGAFRIRDLAPGEYVVEAVHETLGEVAGKVTVAAGRSTGFTLTIE
jgi:plastocyanin